MLGPVIGGKALIRLLGFRTLAAFQRARTMGALRIQTFPLPGRRGHFAVTAEVCDWLIEQRREAADKAAEQSNHRWNSQA